MAGPKIAVVGAGSSFFGKQIIRKMASSPVLAEGTLALVDTDPNILETMLGLAKRVFDSTECAVTILGSTERKDVLADSDFVVLTFSHRNAHYRRLDTEIAAKHGIRMCSSDTIGPGGIFRALREVPKALQMARDAEQLAPQAWLVNFVNPTSVLGMALMRFAPSVNSFALCDGHHEPHNTLRWCKRVGILPDQADSIPAQVHRKLDLAIGGVNHCTWIIRFRYDGHDMMPAARQKLLEEVEAEKQEIDDHSKRRFNSAYSLQLLDLYGIYPTAIGHTKEYVPFFQGYGAKPCKPEPITLFDGNRRAQEMRDARQEAEQYAAGVRSVEDFLVSIKSDHASDIMESMWGDLGKSFYINTQNQGAVGNLPDDAYLELRCDVDMHGPRPQPLGCFPRGVLALQQQVLDTHELTAKAAATGDRTLLRRAMLTDPICNNIPDADACITDMLEAQKEALPSFWYD